MPKQKRGKRIRQIQAAHARSFILDNVNHGEYGGFEGAILNNAPAHKERMSPKTERFKIVSTRRARVYKIPPSVSVSASHFRTRPVIESASSLARRADAVLTFFAERASGASRSDASRIACTAFGVSERSLRRWVKTWLDERSVEALGTKLRGGRAKLIDDSALNDYMVLMAGNCGYEFSLEEMAEWVKEEFGSDNWRALF